MDEKSFSTTARKRKEKKFPFTRPLQLIHLLFGGSFIRPLIILSFRSSSFLLPIATKSKKDLGFSKQTVEQTNRTKFPRGNSCTEEFKKKLRKFFKSTQEGRINFSQLEVDWWLHHWLIIRMNSGVRILKLISTKVVRKIIESKLDVWSLRLGICVRRITRSQLQLSIKFFNNYVLLLE